VGGGGEQVSDPAQGHPYQAPPPFVTHEQLGGVHRQIGALEKGQESLIAMYGHYRGEMLGQFDLLRADIKKATEAREAAPSTTPQLPTPVIMQALAAIGLFALGSVIGQPLFTVLKAVAP
jgi:hypothetical protein